MEAHPAETQEEHHEYQQRLQKVHRPVDKGARRCKKRQVDIYKIACHAGKHGDGQCPVFDKMNDSVHVLYAFENGCKGIKTIGTMSRKIIFPRGKQDIGEFNYICRCKYFSAWTTKNSYPD